MTKPFDVHESGAFLHGTKPDLSAGELLVPRQEVSVLRAHRARDLR